LCGRHIQRRRGDYMRELFGRDVLRYDGRDYVHVVRSRHLLSWGCFSVQRMRDRYIHRFDWYGDGVYSVPGGDVSY
jgi:hypothetical protein